MSLADAISAELKSGRKRVRSFEYGGRRYWIKSRERLSLRMRLQKGSADKAFDKERRALEVLAAKDLPVSRIVACGADWIAIEDGGRSLAAYLRNRLSRDENQLEAFEAGGAALAQLHNSGVCHGRPAIRDLLWDNERITFIDFENYSETGNTARASARDVLFFVHSFFSVARGHTPELDAAAAAYRDAGGQSVWDLAAQQCRRFRWVRFILAPLLRLRRADRGKDLRAIVMTIDYFSKSSKTE